MKKAILLLVTIAVIGLAIIAAPTQGNSTPDECHMWQVHNCNRPW